MKKIGWLALVIVMYSAGVAMATPSSIIRIPSTDIQPYGTFHLGIDNTTTMFRKAANGAFAQDTVFGLTGGAFEGGAFQVEFGVDIREPADKPLTFNVKLGIPEGTLGDIMPAIAVGVYDWGTSNENDYNILYVEAAKTVGFMGRVTLGFFTGSSSHLVKPNGGSSNSGFMFSFDRRLPEINERLWFGFDFQGTKSSYGATSFGFSWAFSENASLVFGYIQYNEENAPGAGKPQMTWQVDFDF